MFACFSGLLRAPTSRRAFTHISLPAANSRTIRYTCHCYGGAVSRTAHAFWIIVAVMLTVQQPLVTSTFALRETIVVLAGVVVGGMNRLLPATLGGFAIGYASGLLGGALPTAQSQYLPSFLFGLVILTLLVRPGGLFTRGGGPVESPLPSACTS